MKKFLLLSIIYISIFVPAFAQDDEVSQFNVSINKNVILGDVWVYNLSNGKLHSSSCEWAEKCTRNCIYISKKDIKKIFFIPCAVCGGGVIDSADDFLKENE